MSVLNKTIKKMLLTTLLVFSMTVSALAREAALTEAEGELYPAFDDAGGVCFSAEGIEIKSADSSRAVTLSENGSVPKFPLKCISKRTIIPIDLAFFMSYNLKYNTVH